MSDRVAEAIAEIQRLADEAVEALTRMIETEKTNG